MGWQLLIKHVIVTGLAAQEFKVVDNNKLDILEEIQSQITLPNMLDFQYNFNLEQRTITLSQDIENFGEPSTSETVDHYIEPKNLFTWFDSCMNILENNNKKGITIKLSTWGGRVDIGVSIIQRMLESPNKITVKTYGIISSMGIFILAAGDVRIGSPLTQFMHHEFNSGMSGRHCQMTNQITFDKKYDNEMCKWLASRTKKDYKFWLKIGTGVDHWFFAEDALKYGLIHKIR